MTYDGVSRARRWLLGVDTASEVVPTKYSQEEPKTPVLKAQDTKLQMELGPADSLWRNPLQLKSDDADELREIQLK